MIGWHISVNRLGEGEAVPPTWDSDMGDWIATWRTGLGGLDWIDALVEAGDALLLGGNGYPVKYAVPAQHLLPRIIGRSASAKRFWRRRRDDIITSKYPGGLDVDRDAAERCAPQDWLIIKAWDES